MAEFSVEFNLIYQWLLSIFLLVGSLLWECFYCIFLLVLVLYYQVHWGEITFSDLLDGFEKLVETSLIDSGFEHISPVSKFVFMIGEELYLVAKSFKLNSERFEGFLFFISCVFEEKFKDQIVIKGHLVGNGLIGLNYMNLEGEMSFIEFHLHIFEHLFASNKSEQAFFQNWTSMFLRVCRNC